MNRLFQTIVSLIWVSTLPLFALVNYDGPIRQVGSVMLLPDADQKNAWYYLPTTPHVARNAQGLPELMVVKFIDPNGKASGGLFHMLVTLDLPKKAIEELKKKIKKEIPGAMLLGPVPLRQDSEGSFSIVSATLSDKGFTRSLISSGRAPITPGSKAAVAASLSPHGATLLWESLMHPTSDVSIALHAYYEAKIPAYRAKIRADISTVYDHMSKVLNRQKEYTKRQLRDIYDEMVRTGIIEIEVLDRLPEKSSAHAMQRLTDMAAEKLTKIIFDTKTGFTAMPKKEQAVEKGQLKGRQSRGWITKLFKGTGDQKYYTDNQFVLKKRKDINRGIFSINITRNSVVKVPFDSAGNISGLYEVYKSHPEIFRVVNLADPAFQKREVFFRIDGDYTDAFEKIMNFGSVNVRKVYEDANRSVATGELLFTREDIRKGKFSKSWTYARLGEESDAWLNYDYRVTWSVKGNRKVQLPEQSDAWFTTKDPIVTIAPPLERLDLQIDADRLAFDEVGIKTALVMARYTLFGKPKREKIALLKHNDADSLSSAILFHDPGTPVEYKVNWYPFGAKAVKGEWTKLDEEYLMLTPPKIKR